MKTPKEIFKEVWIDTFGHSVELDNQLKILEEHDYIYLAMQKYADQYKSLSPEEEYKLKIY